MVFRTRGHDIHVTMWSFQGESYFLVRGMEGAPFNVLFRVNLRRLLLGCHLGRPGLPHAMEEPHAMKESCQM